MKITVRYFASLREVLGAQEQVVLPGGGTVGALRDHLLGRSDAHGQALARSRAVRCALNQRMCCEDEAVSEGAEVAFFPPVTGG
ncbi:MAG: molybdopterin converting factor subunit 1 [Rubrivivax sp.]|jgi:molybdopterin synthase sulfur carrier subunit